MSEYWLMYTGPYRLKCRLLDERAAFPTEQVATA